MQIFARIDEGTVVEIVYAPDGVDIATLYTPEFVATLINVNDFTPIPEVGWVATPNDSGGMDLAPYTPSAAEISAVNSLLLQQHTQLAAMQKTALSNRISTLQDAIDLEMATPAEVVELPLRQAQLLEWKRYAIFLGRVTTQSGWALTVEWPVQPAQGMDLTVSAVSRPTVQAS